MTKYLIAFLLIFYSSCNLGLTKCDNIQEWKISGYKIVKSKCLGPAGPNYYPISLYEGKTFLGENGFQKDGCKITFQPGDGSYLIFNICDTSFSKLLPDKTEIDLKSVDSIIMFSNSLKDERPLTRPQIDEFINDWNKSKVSDYRDQNIDSIFFPTYQYKLTVYSKSNKREFVGANFLINDRTNWTYYISKNEDVEYFNKLWNK